MKIALGCDHGGLALKEELAAFLRDAGHAVIDFGTHGIDPVDYPDFAFLVAAAVADRQTQIGIMIDGAGIGSAMVANKIPGIRAAMCNDLYAARNARQHNAANVLTLGAMVIGAGLAKEIVTTFLKTEFEARHQRRIDKITRLEQQLAAAAEKKVPR
jgi:ribose 5-phosphate isomerase B